MPIESLTQAMASIGIAPPVLPRLQHPISAASATSAPVSGPSNLPGTSNNGSSAGSDTAATDPGQPLYRHAPVYPAEAERRGVEGKVEMVFTIRADGTTDDIGIVRSDPPGIFDQAAIRSQKTATYTPARRNGIAVDQPGSRVIIYFRQPKE